MYIDKLANILDQICSRNKNKKELKILFYSPQRVDVNLNIDNINYCTNEEEIENLERYNVVVLFMFEAGKGLSFQRQQRIIDYVQRGGKIIGIHDVIYAYYNENLALKLFGNMLVETWKKNIENKETEVYVKDKLHPICQEITKFNIIDKEIFEVDLPEGVNKILFEDGCKKPVGWYKKYNSGDIFCFKLGHDKSIIENKNVQQILINTIKWFSIKRE